jgi:polysaccharide pyruvyl transferase WcaK-like protein
LSLPFPRISLPDRPRFLLVGCFGEQNAGDEALLGSALHLLRSRWPEASITVFSQEPEKTARAFNVEALSSMTFLEFRSAVGLLRRRQLIPVLRAISACDCIIVAGGELLRTDFGLHAVLTIFDRILLGRLLSKPVVMMGVGCGPLEAGLGLSIMQWASRGAPILTREEQSRRDLSRAGIGVPVASCDMAFQLPEILHGVALPVTPKIGIALRHPARTASCRNLQISPADFLRGVARLADAAVGLGATPVFVPFCCRGSDDDRLCHEEVRGLMRHSEAARMIEDEMPPHRLKNLMSAMDLVVGMRLHACVFALAHARPVLALSYDEKVRKQMRQFGCEDAVLSLGEIDAAPQRLQRMWVSRDQRAEETRSRLQQHQQEFRRLFKVIFD